MIGPSRWVFPHSAQSRQHRLKLARGSSRLCRNLLSRSQRDSGPSPGSRDAIRSHQYADPTGVYAADALELSNTASRLLLINLKVADYLLCIGL